MAGLIHGICAVIYLGLGIMQIIATVDGVSYFTGLNRLLCWVLSIFVGWIPLLGTITGVYGAVKAWGWSLTGALALFVGPLVVIMLLTALVAGLAAMQRRR